MEVNVHNLGIPEIDVKKISNGIQINWEKVDDADGYIVYRKNADNTFSVIETVESGEIMSYTDTESQKCGTYTYKVVAFAKINGKKHNSPDSKEISATIDHSYKTVTQKATLKSNGKTERICSVCKHVSKTTTIYSPSTFEVAKSMVYTGSQLKPAIII